MKATKLIFFFFSVVYYKLVETTGTHICLLLLPFLASLYMVTRIATSLSRCLLIVLRCDNSFYLDLESCGSPHRKDDDLCDDENNNEGCGWDGGDCCGDNVRKYFCSSCQCLDPFYYSDALVSRVFLLCWQSAYRDVIVHTVIIFCIPIITIWCRRSLIYPVIPQPLPSENTD